VGGSYADKTQPLGMTNAGFHTHHLHQQVKVNHISQFWAPQLGVGPYITPCGCFPSPLAFRFHTDQAFSPAKTFGNALKQVWTTRKECIKMLATCRGSRLPVGLWHAKFRTFSDALQTSHPFSLPPRPPTGMPLAKRKPWERPLKLLQTEPLPRRASNGKSHL
jgi:hypothetical protein